MPTDVLTARARVAALSRSRGPDDRELLAARTELAVAKLAVHIRQVIAEGPLTQPQVDRLLAELNG